MPNTRVGSCILILVASASVAAAQGVDGRAAARPSERYGDAQVVDAVTREGVQTFMADEPSDAAGRLWTGATASGGQRKLSRLETAASRYGAVDDARRTVVVYIEGLFPGDRVLPVSISPWVEVRSLDHNLSATNSYSRARGRVAQRVEHARQQWLADNGYTGGVRTHVNDGPVASLTSADAAAPQPRGVIEIAPDMPRFRSRMRVETGDVPATRPPGTVVRAARVIKVLPPTPPPVQPETSSAIATTTAEQPDAATPIKDLSPAKNSPPAVAEETAKQHAADIIARDGR